MQHDRSSPSAPEFNSIPAEKWEAGEIEIQKVLNRVSPTSDSEDKRIEVTDYMRRLIKNVGEVEVFQYGSVPLKTYLPQGDIDLTVVSNGDWNCNLPYEVYRILVYEQQYGNDNFEFKDIRFIDAEVKLVKCILNDILIDVSFNQLGGLCALCFLEQVDRLVEKDHLFKRSIILIKSWCYYESHILGAIYGLISTYALETLVVFIFRMYHTSLTSPLQVLYRFLEYYSKFDWGNFCISIDGPVYISSLPDIIVENPINHPFLSGEHLRDYINMFTVPCKEFVGYRPTFTPKVINIIDPLKENNNLGRSIHIGTFFRITFALDHGASKLGAIMELPNENIQEGINKFFENTLKMNQSKPLLKPRVAFDNLPQNNVVEEYYEDDSESETPNARRDTRINDSRGFERYDLFTPSSVPSNEECVGNMNTNGGPDNRNEVSTGGLDESDNLILADLSGDYYGNVRNLLFSQCCQGFPYSSAVHPLAAWFEQNSSHVQRYPNGSVMHHAPNPTARSFIPHTGSYTRAIGKGHVTSLPNRQMNWTHGGGYETGSSSGSNSNSNNNGPDPQSPQGHGQGGARSAVHTQRRLQFGSFGAVTPTYSEPEVTYYLLPRRTESVPNKPLPLTDEKEFPPL